MLSQISASVSVKDDTLHVNLANTHAREETRISMRIGNAAYTAVCRSVLTGDINACHTFETLDAAFL